MASFSDMISSSTPVLVDFYADWCGPCQMMAPLLKELSTEVKGKAKVIKVDVDKNQKVSLKYQIKSIPTLMVFKEGKIMWRHSGTASKEQLKSLLESYA